MSIDEEILSDADKTNNSNKLTPITSPYIEHMIGIASSGLTPDYENKKVKNELNLFLIAQARNELIRATKYTELLDKIDNKLTDKISNNLNDYSAGQLADIMKTITDCMDRSLKFITQIASDDNISVLIQASNTVIDMTKSESFDSSMLKDASSRERVRTTIQQLMILVSKAGDNNGSDPRSEDTGKSSSIRSAECREIDESDEFRGEDTDSEDT